MGVPGITNQFSSDANNAGLPPLVDKKIKVSYDANAGAHASKVIVYGESMSESSSNKSITDHVRNYVLDILDLIYKFHYGRECTPEVFSIVFDGTAPLAKDFQKRGRRLPKNPFSNNSVNPNIITTGSQYMILFIDMLKRELNKPEIKAMLPRKLIISGENVPGEGEHKMMKLSNNFSSYRQFEISPDGDLHFLIAFKHKFDMWLYKEAFMASNRKIKDRSIPAGDVVSRAVEFTGISDNEDHAVAEMTVIFMTLGNDFVPAIPGIITSPRTIGRIFEIARSLSGRMTYREDNLFRLDYEVYREYLAGIAQSMDYLLKETHKEYKRKLDLYNKDRGSFSPINQVILDSQSPSDLQQDWPCVFETNPSSGVDELSNLMGIKTNVNEIMNKATRDYFHAIDWVLAYYQLNTEEVDLMSFYPYSHTPTAQFMSKVSNMQPRAVTMKEMNGVQQELHVRRPCWTALHSLLSIMPKSAINSRDIFSSGVTKWLAEDNPLHDIMPTEIIIESNKSAPITHMNVPIVTFPSPERILEVVAILNNNPSAINSSDFNIGTDEVIVGGGHIDRIAKFDPNAYLHSKDERKIVVDNSIPSDEEMRDLMESKKRKPKRGKRAVSSGSTRGAITPDRSAKKHVTPLLKTRGTRGRGRPSRGGRGQSRSSFFSNLE